MAEPTRAHRWRAAAPRLRGVGARFAAVCGTLALAGPLAATATAAPAEAQTGRPFIVTLDPGPGFAETTPAALRRQREVRSIAPLGATTMLVTTTGSAERLRQLPGVVSVEPDRLLTLAAPDPLESGQWYLDNPAGTPDAPVADADLDLGAAWTRSTGTGVIVAVADSGFELTHPDLSDQWVRNPADDCGDGIDDDDNGFTDDCRGWDFGMKDGDVSPGTRPVTGNIAALAPAHGTQVAGIVAGARNNRGIVGVAPGVRILPLKIVDSGNRLWLSSGLAAMDYAADRGAKVFVASWGSATGSAGMAAAIADAEARGMLVVAAAGNGGHQLDATRQWYPAGYATTTTGVVSVAATTGSDELASFSNRGEVTLAAPGERILTTTLKRGWALVDGTSFAAPAVAGVAALLAAAEPTLTPAELKARLVSGADQPATLLDAGAGRVNAAATLGVDRDSPPLTLAVSEAGPASNGVRIVWSDPSGIAPDGVELTVAGPTGDVVERTTLAAGGGTATATGLAWDGDHVVTLQPLPASSGPPAWTSRTIHTPAAIPPPHVTVHATETAARIQLTAPTVRGARIVRYELRWPDRTTTFLPGTALVETVTDLAPNTRYRAVAAVIADSTAEGSVPIDFVTAPTVGGPTARLTPTVEGVDVAVTPQRSLPGRPPITGYRISADGRSTNISPAGRGTLRGLLPGVTVEVSVTALHGTLEGTTAVVGSVTPYAPVPPEAPLNLTAVFQSSNLVVRWERPPGPLLTGYIVSVNGRRTQVPPTTGFTIVRVGNALSADVEITARNGWGTSPPATITVER